VNSWMHTNIFLPAYDCNIHNASSRTIQTQVTLFSPHTAYSEVQATGA